jgi:hypothetical protein
MRRDDHNEGTHFRSRDRVFWMNGEWFFETREDDHGPYASRDAAEAELDRYVDEMSDLGEIDKPPVQEVAKRQGSFRDLKGSDLELIDKDEPPPTTH